jgi:hypothetical protein
MEAVCLPETLVATCKSTRNYNQDDKSRKLYCCETVKSLIGRYVYGTCNYDFFFTFLNIYF